MHHPVRGGTRGGKDLFKWDDVKVDKDRENYLGHSLMAPVGRWQKGKDLHWYAREKKTAAQEAESIRLERQHVKQEEEHLMNEALGLAPKRESKVRAASSLDNREAEELFRRRKTSEELRKDYTEGERTQGVGFALAPRVSGQQQHNSDKLKVNGPGVTAPVLGSPRQREEKTLAQRPRQASCSSSSQEIDESASDSTNRSSGGQDGVEDVGAAKAGGGQPLSDQQKKGVEKDVPWKKKWPGKKSRVWTKEKQERHERRMKKREDRRLEKIEENKHGRTKEKKEPRVGKKTLKLRHREEKLQRKKERRAERNRLQVPASGLNPVNGVSSPKRPRVET